MQESTLETPLNQTTKEQSPAETLKNLDRQLNLIPPAPEASPVSGKKNKTVPGNTKRESGRLKFIDLFSGIGGFRIALEGVGGECVFSSEWDKYARQTYQTNFGDLPAGDINEVNPAAIPDFDILCAGFPCQPFSLAGVSKKNSLGREHGFRDKTQGTLFFKIAEIIEARRPNAFLLENVKNLKSHDKGNTFRVIKATLEELGYSFFTSILDARYYVPQHRERIYIVGFDRKVFGDFPDFQFPVPENETGPTLGGILEKRVDSKYVISDKLWQWFQDYAAKHREKGNGFGYGLVDKNSVARTLSARYYKDGSEILLKRSGGNPRRLTPRECARLMGYPDDFKIPVSDTQAYKQFGNSVVPLLVSDIAREISRTFASLAKKN